MTGDVPSAQKLLLEGEWTVLYASSKLLTMTVELYADDDGEIPRVYLGGMRIRADDANHPGNGADALSYQADGSRSQADRSRAWTDTLNVLNSAEIACISHNDDLDTYLGAAGMKHPVHKTDGIRNHVDAPIGHRDTPSVETETETAENKRGNIRTGQIGLRTQDSPYTAEIETFKCSRRWKGVSAEGVDIYLPWDAPVEVPS